MFSTVLPQFKDRWLSRDGDVRSPWAYDETKEELVGMDAKTDAVDILLVEDESDISELIQYNLQRNGYTVRAVDNGKDAIQAAMQRTPGLILLDIMMPGCDGLTVLRTLRQAQTDVKNTPVILLTAKGEESDIVVGLELGADDYMTKPFSPRELMARVKAVLRRSSDATTSETPGVPAARIEVGPITLDQDRHEVWIKNVPTPFTLAEYNLLRTLISKPGRVFTRDQLLEKITGGETYVIDRNVDVHVRAIRKKLGDDAEFIQTVRGVGYKCREQ